jgi:hypothetical protein
VKKIAIAIGVEKGIFEPSSSSRSITGPQAKLIQVLNEIEQELGNEEVYPPRTSRAKGEWHVLALVESVTSRSRRAAKCFSSELHDLRRVAKPDRALENKSSGGTTRRFLLI